MVMKILNLYAGIGGNRKLWGNEHEITAVECRQDIADVYSCYFPNDKVIVGDANDFLLNHYSEYDFIWLSRPCTTHSRANFWASKTVNNRKKYMPDLTLYSEIIFLQKWFKGKFVAENVVPYYKPLIEPTIKLGRHLFWSNFHISYLNSKDSNIHTGNKNIWIHDHGFDLSNHNIKTRKDQIYRNCVHPETGLHILNCLLNEMNKPNLFTDAL